MTIHYHSADITPKSKFLEMAGRHFCISYAYRANDSLAHQIGQSVMLDNGAFTAWRKGQSMVWGSFYPWCDRWLDFPTTWAVIPDVIDGTESAQDRLLLEWPFAERGAPVWHINESLDRLAWLSDEWPRLCFGSAGDYAIILSEPWQRRMDQAFNVLARRHKRMPWIHMLRGMQLGNGPYPFASIDSADIARNHKRPQNDAIAMANRWDRLNCPGRWRIVEEQQSLPIDSEQPQHPLDAPAVEI